ncbi:MAG: hypothetical protein WC850_01120 [Candidatus Gracilibacteria bacterium]
MLYLFTGNNEYLVKEELKKWKNHFLSKFGEFNLTHIQNIEELDKNALSENLLASSFLSEKKMVIIDNIEKVEKDDSKKEFLMSILDKIPENNIIVFSSNSLQERSLLYKKIKELGEIKRFDIKNTYDTKLFIEKKYNSKIDSNAIDKIIAYKSNNLSKIVNELDKLFITKDFISTKDIIDYITPELEETIFVFVDKVLSKDKKAIFNDLDIILENIDIYAFYNSFLGNIRNFVYIMFFKKLGYKNNHIKDELSLGNRAFLVDKTYKINFQELSTLYEKLIDFDKNMKFGKLIGSTKIDLKYELQKVLF